MVVRPGAFRNSLLFAVGFIFGTLVFNMSIFNMRWTGMKQYSSSQSEKANFQQEIILTEEIKFTANNANEFPVRKFERVLIDIYASSNRTKYKQEAEYWQMAPHYNVDDYGVPAEEWLLSVDNMKSLSLQDRVKRFRERGVKTVLYYHSAYGGTTYGFSYNEHNKQGQLPYVMKGCRRKDCFCTDQHNFLPIEEWDAIVFYSRAISNSDRPKVRKPHQRYILWEVEPVTYLMGFSPRSWPNFFNWTHTYRRDADFWEPWGMMNQVKPYPKDVPTLIDESKKNLDVAKDKKKSIAWFVSNCNSRSGRERFAKALQKYIQVDIYGGCGPLKCGRNEGDKCWANVEKEYFFYFAAENSLCKDYITEKFFNTLKKNVVPITFGGGDETNDYNFAPPKSHINAFDYESPEKLAKFLLQLQENKEEYVSYFWWKPYYSIWLGRWKKAHCEICDKLHTDEKKVYRDMQDWWVTQAKCRSPY